ncbi:hypothetical protein BB559_003240 [Furculomyces boomerangus]|uniref:CCHC-type domain-containing protein n=1 Tax=Furculomyces boomerangus TaxID=61424 RepID=A0A2T9YME5_9FUNG|nr:hypothetical protein BB559_003240 [Furculomyces boomerangus]
MSTPTISTQISFEGLPPKFTGQNSVIKFAAWKNKFLRIAELRGWDEPTTIKIFKVWLEGEAEEWMTSTEETKPDSSKWKLDLWFTQLQNQFPPKLPEKPTKLLTIRFLENLNIGSNESVAIFNQQFEAEVKKLDKEIKPNKLIKSIYGDYMKQLDPEVAWTIYENPLFEKWDYQTLMDEFKTKVEKKDLTLLVKRGNREHTRDPTQIVCFNCNEKGHTTRTCRKPRNEELRTKLTSEYYEKKNSPTEERSMLLIQDDKNKLDHTLALGVKRVKVVNQKPLNRDIEMDEVNVEKPKEPKNVEKKNKKTLQKKTNNQTDKIPQKGSVIPSRLLDSNAPITVRELFRVNPVALNETIRTLQLLRNSRSEKALYNNENNSNVTPNPNLMVPLNKIKPKPLSYVVGKILSNDVSFFLDIGSTSCVISLELMKQLNLEFEKKSAFVTAVGGDMIKVLGKAIIPITFEDINLMVQFQVLEECAVPILLGIDFCQLVDGKINYGEETFSFSYCGKEVRLQLYHKSNISENESESSSDEENVEDEESDNVF